MLSARLDTSGLDQNRRVSARAYIETHLRRRHSNRVLHGHPSPIFWQRGNVPVPEIMASRTDSLRDVPKSLNLYVATPYCLPTNPERCGFCLFPSEVYHGREELDTYLGYLEREAEMYRPFLARTPLTHVLDTFFEGAPEQVVAALLGRQRRISAEQLDRISELIDKARRERERT